MALINIVKIAIFLFIIAVIIFFIFYFRNKRKEMALCLFSISFSIFIGEAIIRFFYPQINEHNTLFEYDKELGWKFIPNNTGAIVSPGESHHYIKTNSIGFRDNTYPPKKKKKILFLGDSFVSNLAVKENEVFTEVLEKSLNNTEVLNFGVNGYGQVQEYLLLKKWLNEIKPDLIILMIYIRNDFSENIGGYWFHPRPFASWDKTSSVLKINSAPQPISEIKEPSEPIWRIYRRSHLYLLIRNRIYQLISMFSNSNHLPTIYSPQELYLCNPEPSEHTKLMHKTMKALLLKIANYANEAGVPIVFSIAPSFVQVEENTWNTVMQKFNKNSIELNIAFPNKLLTDFANQNQLHMIDLLPPLKSQAKKGRILYNPNEQHWNKDGNEIVAHSIYNYLKHHSLID